MATPQQLDFMRTAYASAKLAASQCVAWPLTIPQYLWIGAVAAEACVETGWGAHMPPNSRNCLGINAGKNYKGQIVDSNGTEQFPNGQMTGPTEHHWRVYATYADCFADQLHILETEREPDGSLSYQAALSANTVETYITAECAKWSTGITKGQSVLQTYHSHLDILDPVPIEASIPQEMQ